MGRMYTAIFSNVAVAAAQDFFEIVAPSDAIVVLHSCFITQHTDVGDSNEELLRVSIMSGATTSGSGGSTPTAIPLALGDAAFGGSVEANNTTEMADGTIVTHHSEAFNIRSGWFYMPTPECRKILSPSARMAITLLAAPGSSINMNGTIVFEEIGG